MRIKDLKVKARKGLIVFAIINLVGYFGLVGILNSPRAAQAACPLEWIVTDDDAIYTDVGNWIDYGTQGYQNKGVHYHEPEGSGETATWNLIQDYKGKYNVYISWSTFSNRGEDVPYSFSYSGGTINKNINQEMLADQATVGGVGQFSGWYELAHNVELEPGEGSVIMKDSASDTGSGNDYAIADDVRIELIDGYPSKPELISPVDGAIIGPGGLDGRKLDLEWSAVVDPDGGSVGYSYAYRNGSGSTVVAGVTSQNKITANFPNDGRYYWRVRATDNEGNSSEWAPSGDWRNWQSFTIDTTPPTADPNGPYYLKENQKLQLDGSGSNDTLSGIDPASYHWKVRPVGSGAWSSYQGKQPDIGRFSTPGKYQVQLTVEDQAGNQSAVSETTINVSNLLPDAPALSLTRDDGVIRLSWNKVADARGYRVKRNGQYISDFLSSKTTSFVDYGAENGQTYKYQVVAFDMDPGYQDKFSQSNYQEIYIPRPQVQLISVAQAAEEGESIAPSLKKEEGKVKAEKEKQETVQPEEEQPQNPAEESKTNWPMIVAIIIAAVIILGGAAYWWYGVSEDEDQI